MTLVLYLPYINGGLLVSDRLNTLNSGEQAPQDKIIKISKDTVIAFAGTTEACLNIIEEIKGQNRDLSQRQIQKIIRDTLHTIKKESDYQIDAEFLVFQYIKKTIRLWRNTNGMGHSVDPKKIHAIGMHRSILPHLTTEMGSVPPNTALRFGLELLGWVSMIESGVGDPLRMGCNICTINKRELKIDVTYVEPNLDRLRYQFNQRQEDQTEARLKGTIRIGYISPSTAGLKTAIPLIEKIITPDLNKYASKLGYDVNFEFIIDTANGQAAIHLEKVQALNALGVKCFMGGGWSRQAQAALNYVKDNDMLMISSSSTSPLLAIENDRLFRTCPTDFVQAPAIANMWKSWGVEAILIVQRGDSWADGIYNVLVPELEKEGIEVIERVRYAAEVTEFSSYLATMDELLGDAIAEYGVERVGVQTMYFDEGVVLMSQTGDYPNTRDVIWMGTESSGRSQKMIDDGGGMQVATGGFSALMTPTRSWKWIDLDERYYDLVSQPASYYTATAYDAAWIIALSILQAQSTDGNRVAEIFPDVAKNYFGASGWVDLDDAGDRKPGIFDIWGFTEDGFTCYGQYNGIEQSVAWDDAALAANGFSRPGPS